MVTRKSVTTGAKTTKKAATRKPVAPVPARRRPSVSADPVEVIVVAATVSPSVEIPKPKLVRDSFTMPKPEYDGLATLKSRLVRMERPTKKGELIRAGIAALAAMSDADLRQAVERIPSLKTGRPKKSKGEPKNGR